MVTTVLFDYFHDFDEMSNNGRFVENHVTIIRF